MHMICVNQTDRHSEGCRSSPGQSDTELTLVFATTVFVGDFTLFVRLEEQHLSHPFVSVNLRWQSSGVGKFQSYMSFPLGFQRCHVDDNPAASIGTLA